METVSKRYKVIYADPPWKYNNKSNSTNVRSAEKHYQTQTIETLKAMNVPGLSDTSCALFMWATFPCLNEALVLGKAWGFVYKTVAFVWIKQYRNNNGLVVGLGYYTRANAEIVLLFIKGKPLPRMSKDVRQVLISQRGKHSVKPPEIRNRIVRIFGDVPRVELFARSRPGFFPDEEYQGWDVFGNQVNNTIGIEPK